ncbi:MAG: Methylase [Devosia sp.]|uniref:Eco57I restriction-modification methylase domain-containing protein n=1 Tax=Devosia sp. TaxID=1871048 RepID=UPI0026214F87|nr:DNA methyltransferase [Devosia sp.]MDB5541250.1 Methylase [Devosia sp.]
MATDPNVEWLGHVQPVGLVVSPVVLADRGQNPAEQTRFDSDEVKALLSGDEGEPALADTWAFFNQILGWRPAQVAGTNGGAPMPHELSLRIEESDIDIAPTWAVCQPGGGWQLLVAVEARGIPPDARGALQGWEATPHQRLERLLREKGVPAGILVTDEELRFIYAPRGETSGWLAFPLRSLGEVGGRPMLGGLKLLLSSFQLHNAAPEHRLLALLKASRDAQAEVSTKLAGQVLGALHDLLRGLHAADRQRIEALAATRQDHLYDGLLTVLLRLVFLLYAEDRDLIPSRTDADARAIYDQGYGVRALHARLLDNAAHYLDTMDERRGAWPQLLALFRLVYKGDNTGWIKGRGGKLFDPAEFPFLHGQDAAGDRPSPAPVSDGTILRILDGLLTLDGEKLSYRTLDVEQIGSVYETVMGFTIETRSGPALAIRAGKNDRTPVYVDVAALAATKGSERVKFLKEEASRNALGDKVAKPLTAAGDEAATIAALRPIVDERGSPGGEVSPPGTPLLQPTDERRRTGSHYTPRSLTAPIVEYALEPAFELLGPDVRPEQILELKVCDPAMGSGAFLVEACRALGERLVKAWVRWPLTRPAIPPDEDELLHAKRLVAQRCLYGVDKNPRAVDLAKLSLWLATLARDHEFTFVDHALKCGDSLVGLDAAQIAAMQWDTSKPGLPLFERFVADRAAEATKSRAEIQSAPDDTKLVVLEQKHRHIEESVELVRLLGDAVISAFFAEDSAKARDRRRATIESWVSGIGEAKWDELRGAAASLRTGEHPLFPFHWAVEFPEVFGRENPGFDVIVGNPPFAGMVTTSKSNRKGYIDWLQTLHQHAHGNADLVSHFFRRAFDIIRRDGVFGLISTNTIRQGDTRETGLTAILAAGGTIFRANRRMRWPGEAAVVVCVVHIAKGNAKRLLIDHRPVKRISAYLVEGHFDASPERLFANSKIAFKGSVILGAGFTFDDETARKGRSLSLDDMQKLVSANPHNRERIFPYIGGEEFSNDPRHLNRRWIIDFAAAPLKRQESGRPWAAMNEEGRLACIREGIVPLDYPDWVAADWPELLSIVERFVKPKRDQDNRPARKKRWWRFGDRQPGLYAAVQGLPRVVAITQTSPHLAVSWLPTQLVFDQKLVVLATASDAMFCLIQSRVHEIWARFFASTMKDDLSYTPSDSFQTFPFPEGFATSAAMGDAGRTYHDHRAALMVARSEGMTKTYNRFHDSDERAEDIARLLELHARMDCVVLGAYGWDDLAARAEPIILDKANEDDHTFQGRRFWPSAFRDEVLARLLALNAERHAEELRLGVATGAMRIDDQSDDQEDEDRG